MTQRPLCDNLPVVSRENPTHIIGLLRRYDVIRAYNKGLARRAEMERRVQQMRLTSHRGGELVTLEIPAGAAALGYQVRDLQLPQGTIIVTIRREGKDIIPRGDTTLQPGDNLVLMVDRPETGIQVRALLIEGRGLPCGKDLRHGEFLLTPDSPAVGKSVGELGLPRDSLVVEVRRGEHTLVPRGRTVLQAGDRVLVAVEAEDLAEVKRCFGEGGGRGKGTGWQVGKGCRLEEVAGWQVGRGCRSEEVAGWQVTGCRLYRGKARAGMGPGWAGHE